MFFVLESLNVSVLTLSKSYQDLETNLEDSCKNGNFFLTRLFPELSREKVLWTDLEGFSAETAGIEEVANH